MVEVRDKQVYDIVADDYEILRIIALEQLKSITWNTGMINWRESSHNVFTLKIQSNYCNIYVITTYSNISVIKKIDFCETCIS